MQIHDLKRIHPNRKPMIVARGGKRGKTSGRGGKGQSARAGNKRRPEWRDIIKKLPKLRGRGVNSNKTIETKPIPVNLQFIEALFSANDAVTPTTLVEKGVITTVSGRTPSVKILGDGEVTKAFKISGCTISASAKEKIEKAGGTVTLLRPMAVPYVAPVRKEASKPEPKKEKAAKPEAKKEKAEPKAEKKSSEKKPATKKK